ncbi:MAG: biotin/lipoyl-containing protein [Fidelibacterota bacterium]
MREKTLKLEINDQEYIVTINEFSAYEAVVTLNGKTYTVGLNDLGIEQASDSPSGPAVAAPLPTPAGAPFSPSLPTYQQPKPIASASSVVAPLPGLILKILVKPGETVKAGQNLVIMEAMKMENDVQALADATVKSVLVREGDSVNEGDTLIEMA